MSDFIEIKKYPFLYLDGITGTKNNLQRNLLGSSLHEQRHFLIIHAFYQETEKAEPVYQQYLFDGLNASGMRLRCVHDRKKGTDHVPKKSEKNGSEQRGDKIF